MASSQQHGNHGYINQGSHEGNVYFEHRLAPPPYHQSAIKCYQCEQTTWRDTPDCVHCGADIRRELERRRLRRELSCIDCRINRLNLWLIGFVVVIGVSVWVNLIWLTMIGFVACALLGSGIGKLQQYKSEFQGQLYQLH